MENFAVENEAPYLFLFHHGGDYCAFLPLYFDSQGLTNGQIGILLALGPVSQSWFNLPGAISVTGCRQ
ncbi:hypothetical protein P378_00845 [Desulforamulus profundi]|uniref:Uncharacterized protein n=1 Tax=Desulforamulus profundi TaxID=1383067 RepID=A0A2C6MK36_9FIRM|nr:hypothetical protein P378_00845 [Desulforamulus profundi]